MMLRHIRRVVASAPRANACVNSRMILLFNSTRTRPYFHTALSTSRHFSTSSVYDSIADDAGPCHMYLTSQLDPDHPASHNVYRYQVDFQSSCTDVQFVQEGGYIELSPAEKQRYLPEGFAGEMLDEVKDSERDAFMVREPSKLLCRMLDNFAHKCQTGTDAPVPAEGFRYPVQLEDLTNAVQWPSSVLKAYCYSNKDIVSPDLKLQKPETPDERMIVRGPGSVVETTLEAVRTCSKGELPSKVLLTGPRGVGKSACLTHAVYHARKSGWLCVYIPEGYDQVNGGPFIQPIEGIPGMEGLFDNCMMSAVALRNLWRAHHRELRTIPITDQSGMDKYTAEVEAMKAAIRRNEHNRRGTGKLFTALRAVEVGEDDTFPDEDELDSPIIDNPSHFDILKFELKTLEDMVLFGIAFRDYAGPSFIHVVNSLKKLDRPDMPVLIAVDQVNFWDMPTVYEYDDKKMWSTDLCVPSAVKFISEKKSENETPLGKNVMCIGASCARYPVKKGRLVTYGNSRSSIPLSIEVPTYSHVEYLAAIKYYLATGIIDEGITDNEILTYRMHTSNNPRLMRREATQFFLPLAAVQASQAYVEITRQGGGGGGNALSRASDGDVPEEYRRDLEYKVQYERVSNKAEHDVDLSRMTEADSVKHLNDLAEHDDIDDIETCDAHPLASRTHLDLDNVVEIQR